MPVDYSRGLQSVSIGDYTSAISFFQQLTLLHKEDFYSYFYLSGAYFQIGQYQSAVDALDWAIRNDPNNAQARYNRALALEKLERFNEALEGLKDALVLQPIYPQANQALERIQSRMVATTPVAPTPRYNLDGTASQFSSVQPTAERVTPSATAVAEKRPVRAAAANAGFVPYSMLPKQRQSLIGAFADLPAALFTPRRYLQEQSRYRGLAAPLWMYLALALIDIICSAIGSLVGIHTLNISGSAGLLYRIVHVMLQAFDSFPLPLLLAGFIVAAAQVGSRRKDLDGALRVAIVASIPVVAGLSMLRLLIPLVAPQPLPNGSGKILSRSLVSAPALPTRTPKAQIAGGSYSGNSAGEPSSARQSFQTGGNIEGSGANALKQRISQTARKLKGSSYEMDGVSTSVRAAPLWLVVALILLYIAMLIWSSVLVIVGCQIVMCASPPAAVAMGLGCVAVNVLLAIAFYEVSIAVAYSVTEWAHQLHPALPAGNPNTGP